MSSATNVAYHSRGVNEALVHIVAEDFNRWRVAHREALQLAEGLRTAARVFRHYAGELKYHPQTGLDGIIGPDLTDAASKMRDAVAAITALASRWDQELMWLRSVIPDCPADELQRGHAAAREALARLRAALEVFHRVVLEPERASVDAPYGAGAPRRVHPGAQCTWVAERADGLARELSSVALLKENLLLATSKDVAQPESGESTHSQYRAETDQRA